MPDKLAKADVAYSSGHIHSHCGRTFLNDSHYCRHFIASGSLPNRDGKCRIVEGNIDSTYWCDRWERVKAT